MQGWMQQALTLASEAEGLVSPRPPVGAIVLDAGGRAVGTGRTQPSPGPHAEIEALDAAGGAASGGTLVTTLEPCSTSGTTGPCTERVIASGVARVVVGAIDPNPAVDGGGIEALHAAGIEVTSDVLGDRCRRLVDPFRTFITTGRPFVTLKIAASIDGKTAALDGTSRWITGPQARAEVHALRARVDAILVGRGTATADDPRLTARTDHAQRSPRRVLVDASGRTPPTARMLGPEAIVLTVADVPEAARTGWAQTGADVAVCPHGEGGVDLRAGLDALGERGLCHVLVEAGARVAASLVDARLVDRFIFYLAPRIIGGDAPGIFADGAKTLDASWPITIESVTTVGNDLRIDAVPERA